MTFEVTRIARSDRARSHQRIAAISDEAYRRECTAALSLPDPPEWLVESLVRHYARLMGRGVRASRLLARKQMLALFPDLGVQ